MLQNNYQQDRILLILNLQMRKGKRISNKNKKLNYRMIFRFLWGILNKMWKMKAVVKKVMCLCHFIKDNIDNWSDHNAFNRQTSFISVKTKQWNNGPKVFCYFLRSTISSLFLYVKNVNIYKNLTKISLLLISLKKNDK